MNLRDAIKKNPYYNFAAKCLLLLFIIFLLDFSIGKTLHYFYFKQICGREYRATQAIEKTTADILIFGSSRAFHHYIPDVIENKLGETCYNTGSPGQSILFNYGILKAILKRYSPKLIILDILARDLKDEKESYEKLSFLLPYYKDHEEIRPIVDLKSPLEKYKLLSSIYAFNSSFLMIAGGNSEYFKKRTEDIKGYKPLNTSWNSLIEIRSPDKYAIDSVKVNIFESFIEDCHHSGTKLIIVCSPSYIKYDKEDYSISLMKKIAKKQSIDFFDFTNDTSFTNHPHLFADPGHLNAKGSEVFSNLFANRLAEVQ